MLNRTLQVTSDESIYLFVDHKVINSTMPVQNYYEKYRDKDGFLYISFSEHASYGM